MESQLRRFIGVCLGASTVSFVKINDKDDQINIEEVQSIAHNGNPKKVFIEKLEEFNPQNFPVVVTGRKFRNIVNLPTISEPEATETAFSFVNKDKIKYEAIASVGGETFMVYSLDEEGKISNVITKNQCASGTGEFFLQQIKRMNLNAKEANDLAVNAQPFKVSGRCSVFCKSDCTHALNKGVAKSEVASGLSLMMAEKVEELLKKTVSEGKVLVVGGVTRNESVMNFLRSKHAQMDIPDEAVYFEALGAAVYGLNNNIKPFDKTQNMLAEKDSSFAFLDPLEKHQHRVTFKENKRDTAKDGDRCIVGLDVGSTTTKAVVIRESDCQILASVYLYTHGDPIKASRACYSELLSQINAKIQIVGLGTTGSGRHIAGLHALTDGVFNEIVAHATGAVYFDSEVDTIFEIGGQDAKYTYIVNKVPADYAMNEACSAGTGSFIEESAHESLGVKVTDIEKIAMLGKRPPNFSDQCAAFINSDIKTALQENIEKNDVVAGLVYSICINYVNRVKGARPIGNKIFMQGGVCYNKAIPIAMAALTGQQIVVPPDPGLMGAFGVALEVKEKLKLGLLHEKHFDLKELADREVSYKKPFTCAGGKEKCDLKCSINMIEVQGKTYPFGGACNKYYSLNSQEKIDPEDFDYVKMRNDLMFGKYAPAKELPSDAKLVGLNGSFHTHTLYPLYYNFFTELGFNVFMSENPQEEGFERELSSFCFPAQLSLALFQELVNKNCDYYFLPGIMEMYAEDKAYHQKDTNCTCAFLNTEPYFLKQAFKDCNIQDKVVHAIFNYAYGYDTQEEKYIEIARQMGVTDKEKVKAAYKNACRMQKDFNNELLAIGRRILDELENNPNEFAIVLIGRPYNSFAEVANKGIPRKFASRGVRIIPYDMLDFKNEILDDNQYWESGKKILKSAKVVKNHPQLFATYISNFSCAPDSMIMTLFRTIMGMKPSLTLELDGHTADSGINTRIDAALDIITNYRKIQGSLKPIGDDGYVPATVEFAKDNTYFISSDGQRLPISDPRITVLVPSMGDLSSKMFAAAFRSVGVNAKAVPESNQESLKYGRKNSTGKECLPLILCVGSMMEYVDKEWDGNKFTAFFIVQGAGDCRLGMYPVFMRDLIKRRKLRNITPFALSQENGFAGLGDDFAKNAILGLLAADVLDDVRSGIMANSVDPEEGVKIFDREFAKLEDLFQKTPSKIFKQLNDFAAIIAKEVPVKTHIDDSKYIALLGEMYVRRDAFAHKWLSKYFAKHGFIVKDAYISEWLFYLDYLMKIHMLEPKKSFKDAKERTVRSLYMQYAEIRVKKALAKSGFYKFHKTRVEPLINHSKHIFPVECRGETGLTVGTALYEILDHFCGVINVGPFGCMPTRTSEAVGVPEMKVEHKIKAHKLNNPNYKLSSVFKDNMTLPFLTIESDGNVYPQVIEARLETFTLQAQRTAELMKIAHKNGKH
jgi:predicted CoA-substrate-specific enzyme activase